MLSEDLLNPYVKKGGWQSVEVGDRTVHKASGAVTSHHSIPMVNITDFNWLKMWKHNFPLMQISRTVRFGHTSYTKKNIKRHFI